MDTKKQEARLKHQTKKEDRLFKRRKEAIKKKALELATLCDIPVCMIIQSPKGDCEIWPQNPSKVKAILDNYYGKISNVAECKNVSTRDPGMLLTSETPPQVVNVDAKVFTSDHQNHGFLNELSADKELAEFRRRNWSGVGAIQNLERNCYEANAIKHHGNQSLEPAWFPDELYDFPQPLSVFDPNFQFDEIKPSGNFASTSTTTNWPFLRYHEACLWSLPHQQVILPVGAMPDYFPQPDPRNPSFYNTMKKWT